MAGADRTPAWRADCAATAVNLLDLVLLHYEVLSEGAEGLGLAAGPLRPDRTAFEQAQRLVRDVHPALARELRDRFVRGGLPTHGFDTDEPGRSDGLATRFFVVGCGVAAAALGLAAWGFSLGNLTRDQRFILHWLFPLASG